MIKDADEHLSSRQKTQRYAKIQSVVFERKEPVLECNRYLLFCITAHGASSITDGTVVSLSLVLAIFKHCIFCHE